MKPLDVSADVSRGTFLSKLKFDAKILAALYFYGTETYHKARFESERANFLKVSCI